MSCTFVSQIPIFGADESPIFGVDETPTFGVLPPCTMTLRDEFACHALVALGSDDTYALTRNAEQRQRSVEAAYNFADLMLAYREQ